MKKCIFYVLFIMQVLFTSCQPEWKAIFEDERYFDVFVCVPVICEGKDSIMIYYTLGYFYESQNIKLMSYKSFSNEVYKHIEEKKCIEIDSVLYNRLYLNNRIRTDSTILELYNEYGIDSVLNKYLKKDDEALFYTIPAPYNNHVNVQYILYLCSLHHIYFEFLMTEDAYGWFLWHKR
ncbi:hypothetical protein [Bacteroides salyersiae]|uniref:hypothetical protein n=1 Tax=Bacteroides salyersiae TaxID=291644 RepID=UPI001C8B74C1|nr:hypothetical protein [Bacteroides salyersiae]